jgi:putative PIN family toxin of toxin-antitoxin system
LARTERSKVVVDTNVLVRGLANPDSPSGRLLGLCEDRRVLMLLSRRVMQEYRDVLLREELTRRHPAITADVVKLVI